MLTPSMRPTTVPELVGILTEATATSTPLELLGAGSKQSIGRPPQAAATVSSRNLRGIALYEPTELVMSAKAGTPLMQVEGELARNRQMLAFEPIDLAGVLGSEAQSLTVGGIFATNASGSRRVYSGAARDHILGLEAVTGAGKLIRAGGRVMKNVTGYDLCRLMTGSWGTLGMLTEVTFKVLPEPEHVRTLLFFGLADDLAGELMCAAMGSPWEVTGAVHLQASLVTRLGHEGLANYGKAVTALRLETFDRFVPYRRSKLIELLLPYGDPAELDREASVEFWKELRRLSVLSGRTEPLWRISTSPKAGPKVAAEIAAFMDAKVWFDWSGGLLWAEVLDTADAGAADIRRVVSTHGGHATLIRASAAVRSAVPTLHPAEAAVERLEQAIASTFDPAGILNPGRMHLGARV